MLRRLASPPIELAVARRPARQFLGLQIGAVLEVAGLLAAALLLDHFFGAGDRFASVSPHPFWIVVLLASTYYGTAEGLFAAALSATALLAGNLPAQGFNEDFYDWLLGASSELSLWCVAAVVLGGIQRARRRTISSLRAALDHSHEQARTITQAYQRLQGIRDGLEARVAGQLRTVYSMYKASRAIERLGVGEVLMGVADLVHEVMEPNKFSLFLLEGASIEAAISEGWSARDGYAREFDASSPLFQAVVVQRRFLMFTDASHTPILRDEGLLAGPLVSGETGELVGMLKIEDMAFLHLHPTSVENFRVLCDWIGTAYANAQRSERLSRPVKRPLEVVRG